jgi:hypothetical protein
MDSIYHKRWEIKLFFVALHPKLKIVSNLISAG